jgi:hypothetical protein
VDPRACYDEVKIMAGRAPAFDLWNEGCDYLGMLTGLEREPAWDLGQASPGLEPVSGIHCDQMRLDSDETLGKFEKLNPAQHQMGINVEASDAEAAIE